MSTTASLCGFDPFNASRKHYNLRCLQLRSFASLENLNLVSIWKRSQCRHKKHGSRFYNRFIVFAATEGSAKPSQSDEKIPSWARPDSDEPPPWARGKANGSPKPAFEIPYYAYLLASAITAIAAVGSIFEYSNQKPVFGVVNSDSVFYAPLLGFFVFTGIPASAFLWFKSVQTANKEAEEQDRRDGYL
ncbi:uncharacterized protein LOC120274056 [Dioscorea cayenensis subsp. rotundata]|uniref:Uncharacterized protein LOC120274056 n=1 Tax=Dioscorea cayennensis subsp. rotundata TaxID=55577 RepID=A0AB40CEE1_DIOCR|nr:uncharacterized protein LOC120274056 [Dioscorea cayenensis subsp. rotundata]XP_039136738.1 uncharacterized protein LOC120274056 [Dioscorea cayenensis subsp. rotundata]XP_039136739.1 uncharacterized protein LOC120274056 [Dioscorea cayenensis subsp. rotundata]